MTRNYIFFAQPIRVICLSILILAPQSGAAADLDWGLQYRPRFETDDRSLLGETADLLASHRARVSLDASLAGWGIHMAPQHVLQWGTAGSTLSGTSGQFDFHQAYAYGQITDTVSAKIGRQELSFDDERLLGAVNWTQQARTFDAARISTAYDDLGLTTDLFAAILHENNPRNEMLLGFHIGHAPEDLKIGVIALAEYAKEKGNGDHDAIRLTPGLHLAWQHPHFHFSLDSYLQWGQHTPQATSAETTTLAGMAAVNLGYRHDLVGDVQIGTDFLSGDDDSSDRRNNSFDTLFATNHKFYGYMDYFLNIPNDTSGLGLIDIYGGWSKPMVDNLSGGFAIHRFLVARETANSNRSLGTEVDAFVHFMPAEVVKISGGYSLFLADSAMVDIGRSTDNQQSAHWLWLQVAVTVSGS